MVRSSVWASACRFSTRQAAEASSAPRPMLRTVWPGRRPPSCSRHQPKWARRPGRRRAAWSRASGTALAAKRRLVRKSAAADKEQIAAVGTDGAWREPSGVRGQGQVDGSSSELAREGHEPVVGHGEYQPLPELTFLERKHMEGIVHAPRHDGNAGRRASLVFAVRVQPMEIDVRKSAGVSRSRWWIRSVASRADGNRRGGVAEIRGGAGQFRRDKSMVRAG